MNSNITSIKLGLLLLKLEFMMKRLGQIINDKYYDLPERFAAPMLDAGYIFFARQGTVIDKICCDFSFYQATDKGKQAYKEWLESRKCVRN
jgi:hypothetical protein